MNENQTILLVDDSVNDLELMRAAFALTKRNSLLQEVQNGEDAIAYLKGEGPYGDRNKFPLPTVMLLDLNMPKTDGFGVLAWVRAQPGPKRLVIYVLSASMRSQDVKRALDLGANAFLVKPSDLETLGEMMHRLTEWIHFNQFASLIER